MEDLKVALGGIEGAVAAAHAEAHMRLNEGDLDLAWRYEGLALDEKLTGRSGLPVLAGDADIMRSRTVRRWPRQACSRCAAISGEIRRLALLVTPERGLLVSGPFSIRADGLVDATLEVIVVDPAGFAQAFKPAFPEQAAKIDTLAAVPAQAGPDGTPEIKLPVTIAGGNAMLGFIPLGQIAAVAVAFYSPGLAISG
jgi:hypothetical protein